MEQNHDKKKKITVVCLTLINMSPTLPQANVFELSTTDELSADWSFSSSLPKGLERKIAVLIYFKFAYRFMHLLAFMPVIY